MNIKTPKLKWPEFTDKHYSIFSHVDGSNFMKTYRISFVETVDDVHKFNIWERTPIGMDTPHGSSMNLEACKEAAQKCYDEDLEDYLNRIVNNLYHHISGHKENDDGNNHAGSEK